MRRLLLVFIFFPLLCSQAYAQGNELLPGDIAVHVELNELLPPESKDITGGLDDNGHYDSAGALRRLWDKLLTQGKKELAVNMQELIRLVMVSLLCALCCTLTQDKTIQDYINMTGVCAIGMESLSSVDGLIQETVKTLSQVDAYSKAALPAIFTMAAAGGAPVSASARYGIVYIGLDMMMSAAQKVIVPLAYAFLCLSLCRGLFENPIVRSCQQLCKWLATMSLSVLTLAFCAFISVSGAVTGSVDAIAVKAARTVIATSLPVVGGMISDAAATVLAAANMIKSSSGVLSLVAIGALCGVPVLVLLLRFLMFRLAAISCEMIPGSRISGFIKDLSTALGILLGLLGTLCLMLFVSIMSAIRAVN